MAPGLDDVTLNLNADAQSGLSIILAMMMFSVGLGLSLDDFRRVLRRPGVILFGTALQVFALPALTFLLTFVIAPTPSIAPSDRAIYRTRAGSSRMLLSLKNRSGASGTWFDCSNAQVTLYGT